MRNTEDLQRTLLLTFTVLGSAFGLWVSSVCGG